MKIRTKMILAVTLVVLMVGLITSGMWYYNSVNTINHYLKDYSDAMMKNTYEAISAVTDRVNYTEIMIANNMDNIIMPLKYNQEYGDAKEYQYEVLQNDRKIDRQIVSVYGYEDDVSGIIIFPAKYTGKVFKVGTMTASEEKLYQSIRLLDQDQLSRGSVMLFPEPVNPTVTSSIYYLVPMVQSITDNYGNVYGYISVLFDYQILEDIAQSRLPEESQLQIMDQHGQIVYSNCGITPLQQPKQNLYFLMKDQAAYHELQFEDSGWSCRIQIPADALMGEVNRTVFYIILIYVVLLSVSILIVVLVCYKLTKNILVLNMAMQRVSAGNLKAQVDIPSKDEIGSMAEVFNHMTAQLQELIDEVKRTEEEKRQTEISFLQAQINPHFLSNVLNTVTWMANLQHADNIAKLTTALVELLHSAMRKGKEIITVEDELHYIASYVEVEQYCYVDNVEVIYDVDESAKKLCIPRFLLQPIAENALIHSLNELTDRVGELRITVRREKNQLLIIMRDNGKGMTPDQIAYVMSNCRKERTGQEFSSIGIRNCMDRISLLYGDPYGIQYESQVGKYTSVTITLPAIEM